MKFTTIVQHLNERIEELRQEILEIEEIGAVDEDGTKLLEARRDELCDLRDMLVNGPFPELDIRD
jgi:hypothetical protein